MSLRVHAPALTRVLIEHTVQEVRRKRRDQAAFRALGRLSGTAGPAPWARQARTGTLRRNPSKRLQGAVQVADYRTGFSHRLASIEHARPFCRESFDHYNHQHRPSGISLVGTASVRYGRVKQLHVSISLKGSAAPAK